MIGDPHLTNGELPEAFERGDKIVQIPTKVIWLCLLKGLQLEVQSFWVQRLESLDPVAFVRFVKGGLLPMYLLYYVNRKIF